MRQRYIIFYLLFFSISWWASGAKPDSTNYPNQHLFGNIFTDFRHDLLHHSSPNTAFELSTALLGYKVQLSKYIKATLIYDVTHTTDNIITNDTAIHIFYTKGSQYTAFLKMAEIDWQFAPSFELSAGQLLNQQYLTVQDKFWGYRFVSVTSQERFRFGYPADFGMRLTYRYHSLFNWSIGAVNGDGPFARQDEAGTILFQNNVEYRPLNKYIVKLYSGFENKKSDQIFTNALFLGYHTKLFKIGFEYNRVDHSVNSSLNNKEGSSIYGALTISPHIDIFARYDYLIHATNYRYDWLGITGFNYHQNGLNTGLNLQYFTSDNSLSVFWSFGIFF